MRYEYNFLGAKTPRIWAGPHVLFRTNGYTSRSERERQACSLYNRCRSVHSPRRFAGCQGSRAPKDATSRCPNLLIAVKVLTRRRRGAEPFPEAIRSVGAF
jgi:hypothetical protein